MGNQSMSGTSAARVGKLIRVEMTFLADVSWSDLPQYWVADKTDWFCVCERCTVKHGDKHSVAEATHVSTESQRVEVARESGTTAEHLLCATAKEDHSLSGSDSPWKKRYMTVGRWASEKHRRWGMPVEGIPDTRRSRRVFVGSL